MLTIRLRKSLRRNCDETILTSVFYDSVKNLNRLWRHRINKIIF